MHIPDGFLDPKVAISSGILSAAGIALAARKARIELPARRVPLMGLAAAFVFAAQMLNFPVAGGTSGHLIGAVLCSVLLGPSAAVLVVSSVLIVQCLAFGDGGVLALGANVFNMAIVSSVGGYAIYRGLHRLFPGPRGRLLAVAVASWVATVVAAVVCAGQLALSGTVPWTVALPAMAYVHMLIGVGEAIITTLVIATIAQTKPELLDESNAVTVAGRGREFVFYGLIIALGLALFISPFASKWPDGLDRVAESFGFQHREMHLLASTPLNDYRIPGIHSVNLATALAVALGTIVVFGLGWGLARILVPAVKPQSEMNADTPEASGA